MGKEYGERVEAGIKTCEGEEVQMEYSEQESCRANISPPDTIVQGMKVETLFCQFSYSVRAKEVQGNKTERRLG